MPQLDFFTIHVQVLCLIVSLVVFYVLLLKYAVPSWDVFLRLRVKKLSFYWSELYSLVIMSLNFKHNTKVFLNKVFDLFGDIIKVYNCFFDIFVTKYQKSYLKVYNTSKKIGLKGVNALKLVSNNTLNSFILSVLNIKNIKGWSFLVGLKNYSSGFFAFNLSKKNSVNKQIDTTSYIKACNILLGLKK